MKFPHERDWFLYFRNPAPKHRNTPRSPRVTPVNYVDELWSKIRLQIYT